MASFAVTSPAVCSWPMCCCIRRLLQRYRPPKCHFITAALAASICLHRAQTRGADAVAVRRQRFQQHTVGVGRAGRLLVLVFRCMRSSRTRLALQLSRTRRRVAAKALGAALRLLTAVWMQVVGCRRVAPGVDVQCHFHTLSARLALQQHTEQRAAAAAGSRAARARLPAAPPANAPPLTSAHAAATSPRAGQVLQRRAISLPCTWLHRAPLLQLRRASACAHHAAPPRVLRRLLHHRRCMRVSAGACRVRHKLRVRWAKRQRCVADGDRAHALGRGRR